MGNRTLKEIVRQYIKAKPEVEIWKTDEAWSAEDWHYAVVVINSNGFWLNAFKHERTAQRYCNKLRLKLI